MCETLSELNEFSCFLIQQKIDNKQKQHKMTLNGEHIEHGVCWYDCDHPYMWVPVKFGDECADL